jgi:hypothetical protein
MLALTVVIGLTCSPHCYFHDCLLLAVPAALTIDSLSLAAVLKIKTLSQKLWTLMLLLIPLLGFFNCLLVGFKDSMHLYLIICMALLFLGSIYVCRLTKQELPESSEV